MIDLSAATPAWAALPDLNVARPQQFTATLLPDGRVFIAGGVSGGADGGVCEIFDPRNPGAGWVDGPAMKYVRTYHSSFILLHRRQHPRRGRPAGRAARPTPHERFFPDYFDMLRPVDHRRAGDDQLRRQRSPSTRRTPPTSPKSCCCAPAR